MAASYAVFARDATNNEIGQVDDFESLTLNPHFNDIGAWALTVPNGSPNASLLTSGAGIVVYRNGSVYFSGPLGDYHLTGNQQGDTLTVGGPDDMTVLADRLALPAHGYPYVSVIAASTPLRYYRMDSTTDSSGNAQTATAVGGVSLDSSLIDDPNYSGYFDGTGYFSVPTTGMPTGNGAISMECWVWFATTPAVNMTALGYGAAASKSGLNLFVTSAGKASVEFWGGIGTITSGVIAANTAHHLAATYTGTTLTLYVDGAAVGTSTPGTMTLAATTCHIGANSNPSPGSLWTGDLDEAAVYNTALSAATIASHYTTGISRFGSQANEQAGYGLAGAGIWAYVDNNAGPDAGGAGNGDSARINAALSIGSQPTTVGTALQASARFDNLLTLIQGMATAGGDIGFRVLQSGTGLALSIYTPADKTSNAKFSRDLGNLLDYDYELLRPRANYVFVLGGGQGTARQVIELSDSASITSWGRIEGTVDARDTSDISTLQARGNAYLSQNKSQVNFSCTAVDTATLAYGTDYGLGDKVTVYLPDGTTVTDLVREVKITLDRTNGESVAVGIGNPGNGAILTPANAALRSMLGSHITVATRVAQLERRW